jgi:hypothetical protein
MRYVILVSVVIVMNILWPSFLTSKLRVMATCALNGNAFDLNLEVLNFGVGWVTDLPH